VRQGNRTVRTQKYIDVVQSVKFGGYKNVDRPAAWLATTGAAFASAMGRTSLGSTNALLAAANIDLGMWLPNLLWLHERRGATLEKSAVRMWRPGFTRLFDEILGRYDLTSRYSFITDGGHWDNLGLVELLRRNCDRIYCIDASADPPGAFTALRESLTLGSLELGIDWDPGTLDRVLQPLTSTDARPASTSVATFAVPRSDGYASPKGKNVTVHYAKLQATLDMDLTLRRFAAADPIFPRYSTMRQFLSSDQFGSLVAVGRCAGNQLREAAQKRRDPAMLSLR
jgi:hypothetical protein